MTERIESRLREMNISARAASLRVSRNPDLIRSVTRFGDDANPKRETLQLIATALEVSYQWLTLGTESTLEPGELPADAVPDFGGFIQAGSWLAVDEYFQQDNYEVPEFVLRHPRYAKVRQYAYLVRGDSMNAVGIEDGMWVIAADASEFIDRYRETESGDMVVVERTRAQGAERELTIKEIRFYRDRYELLPRSTNPVHRPIVVPLDREADDGIEIKLIGVVLTAHRDFTKGVPR